MFYVKTAQAGTEIPLKWLLSSRRLRSTVTPTSATQRDNVSSRGGAEHDSARSERPEQPGGGGRHDSTTTTAANEISVDFDQTREAYKSKDSLELLRSLVVFKLCSYDFLVDKNKEVMRCYLTFHDVNVTRVVQVNLILIQY